MIYNYAIVIGMEEEEMKTETEKDRRRRRVELGISSAQRTTRSENKYRRFKFPGRRGRKDWKKEEDR